MVFLILNLRRMRSASSGVSIIFLRRSLRPLRIWAWVRAKAARLLASAVSSSVPSASTMREEITVLYELSEVPQHMPLALLAKIPPIKQLSMDAGSGPIFLPNSARILLAPEPMMPGCRVMRSAPSPTRQLRQPLPMRTSTESDTACPERLVPAARKVTGTRMRSARPTSCTTSASSSTSTTILGIRRYTLASVP